MIDGNAAMDNRGLLVVYGASRCPERDSGQGRIEKLRLGPARSTSSDYETSVPFRDVPAIF